MSLRILTIFLIHTEVTHQISAQLDCGLVWWFGGVRVGGVPMGSVTLCANVARDLCTTWLTIFRLGRVMVKKYRFMMKINYFGVMGSNSAKI